MSKPRGKHALGANDTNKNKQPETHVAETNAQDDSSATEDNATQLIAPLRDNAQEGNSAAETPIADTTVALKSESAPSGSGASPQTPVISSINPGEKSGFVVAGFGEIPAERRKKGLKVFGITLGIIASIVLIAYLIGAVVFTGRFVPNTTIGGKDISMRTDEEVAKTLQDFVSDYQLDIVGNGFSYRLAGSDIGLTVDTDSVLKSMHADLNAWEWPLLLLQPGHDETNRLVMKYDKEAYEPGLRAEVDKYNETAKDPVNATIVFDEPTKKFVVKAEEPGTKLSPDAILASTAETIDALETKLAIDNKFLIQPAILSTDEKLISAAELASGMVSAHLALFLDGKLVSEVDGTMLSQFVTINDQYEVTFKDEELNDWIDAFAESFNTVGTERVYTRPDGKQIAVSGGVYGWEIDTDALKESIMEGLRAGQPAEIGVPCLDTAAVFNGQNQPDWGPRYIDVDLSEQYVRFYGDDGAIIWEAPCISGTPDGKHDTGKGVWEVNGKESPSKLIGYEDGKKIYETSVKYWMPFEGNGIGFHDATWQPSFGGSMYANGYGSHGCVNLSYSDAETLYGLIKHGDVVVVHG